MGPDSQGQHLPRKLCLITTPFLIICLILIIFPWGISSHKNANNTTNNESIVESQTSGSQQDDKGGSVGENKAKSSGYKNIRTTLNDNGSTTSGDGGDYVTGEFLRKALINHTLAHGGEQDLDQLIFSALPQGSKLVLQSVKVVETDENGDPLVRKHKNGKAQEVSPVHWDVKITNATHEPDPDSETDEEDYEESNEELVDGTNPTKQNTTNSYSNVKRGVSIIIDRGESVAIPVVKSAQQSGGDLTSSGSHSQANYKTYGAQDREKEKILKHHHGNDVGKTNKIVHTDTDGKTITNYRGKEDGLKDYKNEKGKSSNDEGERYRDTKKKNKGRRVSGFKRVYHKEEFQRTEHFFDDEDAKRIQESYGLKGTKEDAKHGLKDDDRKYHGKKTEYTDGKEIKDEKGTSHGFTKGQHTAYKDSEKHRLSSNYAKKNAQTHGSPPNYNPNNYNQEEHNEPHQQEDSPPSPSQYHHPSHNYHASYSHPSKTTIRQPPATPNNYNSYYMNFKPGYLQTHFTPSSNPLDNANTIAVMSKVPLAASFVVSEPQSDGMSNKDDSSFASSTDEPAIYDGGHDEDDAKDKRKMWKSRKDKKHQPDELKMYFSPRYRHVKEMDYTTLDHAPPSNGANNDNNNNKHAFTPSRPNQQQQPSHQTPSSVWNNFPRTTFTSKIGGNNNDRNESSSDRAGRHQFVKSNPLLDPKYGGYSTLVKFNPYPTTSYINLEGNEEGLAGSSHANESESAGQSHHPATADEVEDDNDDDNEAILDSNSDDINNPKKKKKDPTKEEVDEENPPDPNQDKGYGYRQPNQHRRPPGSRWISLSLGDPELVKEIQANPFNRHHHPVPTHPHVKMRRPSPPPQMMRPGRFPPQPRYPPPPRPRPASSASGSFPHRNQIDHQSQYDVSKYPPNVVVSIKRGKVAVKPSHSGDEDDEENDEDDDHTRNLVPENNNNHNPHIKNKNVGILSNAKPPHGFHPLNNNRNPKNRQPHKIIPHSIPPFMNSLMDSVANFFGSVG